MRPGERRSGTPKDYGSNVVLQRCVQVATFTGCVVLVLLVMATDPSWDELQKGIPASLVASGAGWLAGKMFK